MEARETPGDDRQQLVRQIEAELVLLRNWLNRRKWRGSEERLITQERSPQQTMTRVRMIKLSYMISLRHSTPVEKVMYLAEDARLYENNGNPVDLRALPVVQDGYADPLAILLATLRRTHGA